MPHNLFDKPYSTILYSSDNELLSAHIADDGQWRFPECDSLPQKYIDCLIEFEDKRFYKHNGLDILSLLRATYRNIEEQRIVEGGSTITMQVARMARGNQSRTFYQKAIEIFWAWCIEIRYTKEEILLLHASHAPFGGNVVGVEAASWRYFGRNIYNLSWAEYATLAVLPNAPALIHPGRNQSSLKDKRDKLLYALYCANKIDSTELILAKAEPIPDAPSALPLDAPHLLTQMTTKHNGTRINSTINQTIQQLSQRIADKYALQYSSNFINNIAIIVSEVETGEIKAYIGNTTHKLGENANQVDIITSQRSTGSILKPFLYGAMLTSGQILPSSLVADVPININGFTPQNYNKKFIGAVNADIAIERSLNVPLVRMLSKYNTGRFMSVLKELGMTTLNYSEDHYGASIILGGAECTLWDICGMYASLARQLNHYHDYGGQYNPADIHPLTKFKRATNEPITSITDSRLRQSNVISASAIWYMFEAMSKLNRPEEEADWQQFSSMKRIAWKTGTSYGSRDAWAIGTTPNYTVGVWIGNASGEGRAGLTGVGYAAPVLFEIFSLLPDCDWFSKPLDDMEPMVICRRSGFAASSICPDVDTLLVPRTNTIPENCTYHRLVNVSTDGKWRVNSSCESVFNINTIPWFVLPPSQEYYYKQYNIDYLPLPPFKSGCSEFDKEQIDIIYPEPNTTIFLPKNIDGERENVIFNAAHARTDAIIYWHIDDMYIGTTQTNHQINCSPSVGTHRLILIDDVGNKKSVQFVVK